MKRIIPDRCDAGHCEACGKAFQIADGRFLGHGAMATRTIEGFGSEVGFWEVTRNTPSSVKRKKNGAASDEIYAYFCNAEASGGIRTGTG